MDVLTISALAVTLSAFIAGVIATSDIFNGNKKNERTMYLGKPAKLVKVSTFVYLWLVTRQHDIEVQESMRIDTKDLVLSLYHRNQMIWWVRVVRRLANDWIRGEVSRASRSKSFLKGIHVFIWILSIPTASIFFATGLFVGFIALILVTSSCLLLVDNALKSLSGNKEKPTIVDD